jgi:Flp pilus assembly protein TadG
MITRKDHTRSGLQRLLRDRTANTLAMTAAAVVPLIGMVGGAVDMSRLYLAQSRLQSACDAGALAARRSMTGTTWTDAANEAGLRYFNMNFPDGKYGTEGRAINYSADTEGAVTGVASVDVPMTLMQVFSVASSDVAVTCSANLNLPNTDVMMVLDTTLSMNDANPGDTIRRIDALNNAVVSFYDTLETAKPPGTTIRYGFVPYSHTVNVGKLLHRDWIQNTGTYDSRVPDGIHQWQTDGTVQPDERQVNSNWTYVSGSNDLQPRYQLPSESCPTSLPRQNWSENSTYTAWVPPAPALPRTRTQTRVRNGTEFTIQREGANCWVTPRKYVNYTDRRTQTIERNPLAGQVTGGTTNTRYHWIYKPVDYDLTALKGTGLGNEPVTGGSFVAQVADNHGNRTIKWPDGANNDLACIEERATRRTDETLLVPRYDMDIDLVPTPTDPATQWKPYLPGVVYTRNVTTANRESQTGVSTNVHQNDRWIFSGLAETSTRSIGLTNTYNFYNPTGGTFATYEGACPSPARKMGTITRAELLTYMGSLRPQGYTYHEIGMLWGLRLISREGLFQNEHRTADAGGSVQRHMIFMVDGKKDTRPFTYSAWGIAATARRRTPTGVYPTQATEDALSEARLLELCTIAKNNKNITLWVIAFGTDLDSTLTTCASPGRAFQANNAAELTAAFANIATQLAELRLTN